jgi:hypothetical protein
MEGFAIGLIVSDISTLVVCPDLIIVGTLPQLLP